MNSFEFRIFASLRAPSIDQRRTKDQAHRAYALKHTVLRSTKMAGQNAGKGKATDARGTTVAAVPGRRAAGLGTWQNPRPPKLDTVRSSRATSSIMEDTTLPTP